MTRPALRPWSIGDEWLFLPIAKNGHRSVLDAIQASGRPHKKEYWNDLPKLPRIVLLREPMERAYSAYRMFLREDALTPDISFNDFLGRILKGERVCKLSISEDMHLKTQWESMGSALPSVIVKWDFERLSKLLGLSNIPHIGEGQDRPIEALSSETLKAFRAHYLNDLVLFGN